MNRIERQKHIETLLMHRNYYAPHAFMERLTAREIKSIHVYLTDVPRTTSIGRVLNQRDVVRIVGVSVREGKLPWNAMKFDCIDGVGNGGINVFLAKHGLADLPRDTSVLAADEVIRITAVLHAEEVIYEKLAYRKDKSLEIVASFMDMIQRRPTDAARLMDIASSRQSLDASLVETIADSPSPALAEGLL